MTTEANTAAWYAWQASQRHIERITDPVARRQAAEKLREHITNWIDRTEVYAAPSDAAILERAGEALHAPLAPTYAEITAEDLV